MQKWMQEKMRYWVYDDEGKLLRKFAYKCQAQPFLQDGWTLVIQPKQRIAKPTVETHGEALF